MDYIAYCEKMIVYAIFFDLRQIDHGYRTQSQVNQ